MLTTIWKEIPKSNYEVSNTGFVRNSKTKRILKNSIDSRGYYRVSLSYGKRGMQKVKGVHQLIAIAFVEKPEGKDFVNHEDGNKLNNHYSNLKWVTPKENTNHAIETGLFNVKETTKRATEASILVNGIKVEETNSITGEKTIYNSISECARKHEVSRNEMVKVIKNKNKISQYLFKTTS